MLTAVRDGRRDRRRPSRARSLRARPTLRAWVPAARGMPLATLAGALAMAATPAALTLAKGDRDLSGALVAAAVIGAAAVALVVEDPAGETLSASPTSLARRRALRLSVVLLGLAVVWAAVVLAAEIRGPITVDDLAHRAAEAAAVSGLAAAVAGVAHRRSVAGAGLVGGVAGPLGALLVTAFAYRMRGLPALLATAHHDRWWLIAAGGWAVAAWTWRDPQRL